MKTFKGNISAAAVSSIGRQLKVLYKSIAITKSNIKFHKKQIVEAKKNDF